MKRVIGLFRRFAGVRNCETCRSVDCSPCNNLLADGVAFDEVELLYRHASVGLALMSRDFRWVRINERLAEINGHPVDAHIGVYVDDLLPEIAAELKRVWGSVIDSGVPLENVAIAGETPAQPGVERHWITNFYPVKSPFDDVIGILSVVSEVTEEVRAKRSLARSEAHLDMALEATGIGTWTWNLTQGKMIRTHMPLGALGYSEAQTADATFIESRVHPDDLASIMEALNRQNKGHLQNVDVEYRVRDVLDRWFWFRMRASVLPDHPHLTDFIIAGTYENIDAERASREDRENLFGLSVRLSYLHSVDEMKEVTATKIGRRLDADYVSFVAVDSASQGVKFEPHWQTDRVKPITTSFDNNPPPPEIMRAMAQGDVFQCADLDGERPFGDHPATQVLKDRNIRSMLIVPMVQRARFSAAFVIQSADQRLWQDHDIKFVEDALGHLWNSIGRAQAEAQVNGSRALLHQAVKLGGVGVFDYDYETGEKFVSEEFLLMTGSDGAEGDVFDHYFDLIHPEDADGFRDALLRARNSEGDGLCIHDHRILRSKSDIRWMQFRGQNVFSRNGVITRWMGAVLEETEQRMLTTQVEEAEQRFRLAGMASQDIIWDRDEVAQKCLWSIGIHKVLGYPLSEEATAPDWAFRHTHPDDQFTTERSYQTSAQSFDEGWGAEYRIRKADESYAQVVDRCIFVRNADGSVRRAVGVMRDVTAQRAAKSKIDRQQVELERVSRLGVMGTMASTLAHELNQPLAAASNYLAVIGTLGTKGDVKVDGIDISGLAEKAGGLIRSAGDIIRRMREFTLTGEISTELVSLHDIIDRALSRVRLMPEAAPVSFGQSIPPRVNMMMVDPVQIEQVVFNLLKNAVEAWKGQSHPKIYIALTSADGLARLTVSDNGPGLDDEALRDIFMPFKSSKQNGLGLGLPICRTIIEAHGGRLIAEKVPEGGASFTLTLPMDSYVE